MPIQQCGISSVVRGWLLRQPQDRLGPKPDYPATSGSLDKLGQLCESWFMAACRTHLEYYFLRNHYVCFFRVLPLVFYFLIPSLVLVAAFAFCLLLFACCFLRSAFCFLLSVFCCVLSACRFLLIAFCLLLSACYFPLFFFFSFCFLLSAVCILFFASCFLLPTVCLLL